VHEWRTDSDRAEADHRPKMMKGYAQARLFAKHQAYRVVVQPKVAIW
jgi:hypothetical protein